MFIIRLLAVLLLLLTAIADAERITLKNGTVINGSIVGMTENDVTIDTADMGQIKIKRRTVSSMSDGPAEPQPAIQNSPVIEKAIPVGAAPITITNTNNNNINQNNTQTDTNSVAQEQTTATPPAAATVASPAASGRFFGNIDVGVASRWLKIHGDDRPFAEAVKTEQGATPVLHWDVLGYRWNSGYAAALFAEGNQGNSEQQFWKSKWLYGGIRGEIPLYVSGEAGKSMKSLYLGVSGGYASFQLSRKQSYDVPAYSYGYYYLPPNDLGYGTIEYQGYGGGLSLGYNYQTDSALGFNIALHGFYSDLNQHKASDSVTCPDSGYHCMPGDMNLITASLVAGVTYSF